MLRSKSESREYTMKIFRIYLVRFWLFPSTFLRVKLSTWTIGSSWPEIYDIPRLSVLNTWAAWKSPWKRQVAPRFAIFGTPLSILGTVAWQSSFFRSFSQRLSRGAGPAHVSFSKPTKCCLCTCVLTFIHSFLVPSPLYHHNRHFSL